MLGEVLTVALALVAAAVLMRVAFRPLWRLRRDGKRLAETGVGEVGLVVEVEQTGTEINDHPEMRGSRHAEALEALRKAMFDVILMDVQMPIMDGLTAARQIRAEEVLMFCARTPIVALTANVMIYQLAEYRAAGMDGHVAKPINVGSLFSALD